MTDNPYIAWKFGADIKQQDGHFEPLTCYVAVSDHDAAREKLSEQHPNAVFHAGRGEAVTSGEWERVFDGPPKDGEVRCN